MNTLRIDWIIVLSIINIPLFIRLFRCLFPNRQDFFKCIKYFFTPDLYSLFKGEYIKDRSHEFMIGFFVMGCGVMIAFEYFLIWIFFQSIK